MRAEIISIGTEILMGEIVDTNSVYLAAELAKIGITVCWVSKIGDDLTRIQNTLEFAIERADVVITSGGLGPTSDDLTREAIAGVLREKMTVETNLLSHLKCHFVDGHGKMPSTNIKQATLIPSAVSIPNSIGTAPGWWIQKAGYVLAALPGPPRELRLIWNTNLLGRLKALNRETAIVTQSLKCFGISEGKLDEMLTPLFNVDNPKLGIYAKEDGVHLRAIARGVSENHAKELIAPMVKEIRSIAGNWIWGEDEETPQSKVADLLLRNKMTLAISENFTGGLIAHKLWEISDNSNFFLGSIISHVPDPLAMSFQTEVTNDDSLGDIDCDTAMTMATLARQQFRADVGLGVTSLVHNQTKSDGAGTLFIGFDICGDRCFSTGYYSGNHLRIRGRAATEAMLGLIRRIEST